MPFARESALQEPVLDDNRRRRNDRHRSPPAQIRTCVANAYGSYLGCLAAIAAHRSTSGTLVPRSVSGSCWIGRCSPWSAPFPPRPPPKVSLLGSAGSTVLWRGPTLPQRACPTFGFSPSRTGLDLGLTETLWRSSVSRACCFSACAGSPGLRGAEGSLAI